MSDLSARSPSSLRWLWRALIAIVAVLALAAGTVLVLLTTRGGQAFVAARVLEIVNGGDLTISVGATDGTWPSHIVLEAITARDKQGQWLSVDRVDLRLHPLALLRARVHAESLTIGTAVLERLPVSTPSASPPKPFDPAGLIDTLRHIDMEHGTIGALQVGEPVIGTALDLQFAGSLVPSGDGVALTADIQRHDAPGTLSLKATGDTRALTVQLNGTLGTLTAGGTVNVTIKGGGLGGTLRVDCTSPCYAGRDTRLDHGTADVTLGGTVRAPHVAAAISAGGLDTTGRRLREIAGALTVDIADDRDRTVRLSGQGTLAGLKTAAPEVAQVVGDAGTWTVVAHRSGATTVIEKLDLASGETAVQADATLTSAGVAPAHLAMTIRAPGRLGGLAQDRSVAHAELTLDRALLDGTANGSLHAELHELSPPPRLAGVLGREATVDAKLAADPSGLRITDVAMISGKLALHGQSLWTGPRAALVHQSSALDVSVAANADTATPQPSRATFALTGPLPALHGELRLAIPTLLVSPTAPAEDMAFTAAGDRRGNGFEITASGSGRWRQQPIELTARAAKGDGPSIAIPQLHLASAAGVVDGTGAVNSTDGTITGTTQARLTDLSVLAGVLGLDLSGTGDIAATFAAPSGKQAVDLRATLRNLKQGDTFSADGLTLTANATDLYGTAQIRARLDSGGGALLGRPVKTVAITANGPRDDIGVTLAVTGAARDPLNIALAGRLGLNTTTTVSLSRLRVQDGKLVAQLEGDSRFVMGPDDMTLSPTRITIANGSVTAELKADRRDNTAAGTVAFQNIAVSAFAEQAPTISAPSNTVIGGRIAFSGPATATAAEATVTATFDTGQGRGQVDIKADARNGRAAISATAMGLSSEPARLVADLPLQLSLADMKARLDMDAPASAAFKWTGDIGRIWPLVPIDDHVFSGQTTIDVSATGTLSAPRVQGGLHLTEGTYENVPQSTVLRHVDLALQAQSSDAFSFTLAAKDRKDGTLQGHGRVFHDSANGWQADIATDFKNLAAFNRDDLIATVTGTMTYAGALTHGALTAQLDVRKSEVRLDQVYTARVPLLRPLADNREESRNRRTNREAEPALPVSLKIEVMIDEPIHVDGSGLDSWWRGKIAVNGTAAAPDFTGEVTADRGSFSFISQSFTLDPASKITLTGGGDIDPELAVVATKQTTDITAKANITGRASAPKVELTSTPALPQDEVLSRLMFQKTSAQLGPLESVQLASAASELTGLTRGGIGGLLQRTLGIDQIGIGGSTGTSLVLGQQVGRNLYVGIEQNLRGTGRQIVLEWRMKRGLSLRSTTAGDLGSDLGVSWRKDY